MNDRQYNPEQAPAIVNLLEGLAILMMLSGHDKDSAILGACRLFAAAHEQATMCELEWMMGNGGGDE